MNKLLSPEEKIRSAKSAINQILKMKGIDISHKKILLDEMIWMVTEAYGKWNTDYISEESKKLRKNGYSSNKGLNREHIYRRKYLINELIKSPKEYENILKNAKVCLVTKKEHNKLSEIDQINEFEGFDRYKKAGIRYYKNR
jgi:hypothetical protein